MTSVTDSATEAGNLMAIHSDAECEQCGELVNADAIAFEIPTIDDGEEPDEVPMRIHALCVPAYLFRVLGENDPMALLGLVRR